MGFKDYPINFILAGTFIIAIVSFAIVLGSEYGFSSADLIDERIDINALEGQINDSTYSKSLISKNATLEDELNTGANALSWTAMWGAVKNMYSITTGFFNIIINLVVNVLGIPAVVFYALVSIIAISIIFSIWRLIITGK